MINVLHSIWLVSYLNCIFYAFFVKWFSILLKFINKYFRWSRWCTRTQSCINIICLYKTCYKFNRKREWPMPNKIKIHGIFHKSKNHNSGKPNNINKKLDIYIMNQVADLFWKTLWTKYYSFQNPWLNSLELLRLHVVKSMNTNCQLECNI